MNPLSTKSYLEDVDGSWPDSWRIWRFLTEILKDGVILDIIYHVVRWYERYPESLLKILHEQAAKKLFPGWGWGLVLVMFKEWSKPFNDIFTWHICMSSCVMTDEDLTKDIPSSLFLFPNFSLCSYTWERCLHANEKNVSHFIRGPHSSPQRIKIEELSDTIL